MFFPGDPGRVLWGQRTTTRGYAGDVMCDPGPIARPITAAAQLGATVTPRNGVPPRMFRFPPQTRAYGMRDTACQEKQGGWRGRSACNHHLLATSPGWVGDGAVPRPTPGQGRGESQYPFGVPPDLCGPLLVGGSAVAPRTGVHLGAGVDGKRSADQPAAGADCAAP